MNAAPASEVTFGEIKDIDLSATIPYMAKNAGQYITVNLLDKDYNVQNIDRKSDYLSYVSMSPDVVEVSNEGNTKGRMTGRKYGSSTIVVTYNDGTKNITKKMIATCYASEKVPNNSSVHGEEVDDPYGYTNQSVYKSVSKQVASAPYAEVLTMWFFDDLSCAGKVTNVPVGYLLDIRVSTSSPNYYMQIENITSDYSYEAVEYLRTYGWHQATYIFYRDPSNSDRNIAKVYLDGNLMCSATCNTGGVGYLNGMGAAVGTNRFKGDFTMTTNNWTYSGEATNSLEARAGNIIAPSQGTISPADENGNPTPLTFRSVNPVDANSVSGNVKLKKGTAAQIAGGGGTEVRANIKVDGNLITVTPEYPLEYNTSYAIRVENTLMSSPADLGRPMLLANAYTITFKTSEDDVTVSGVSLSGKTYSFTAKNNTTSEQTLYAVMSTFDAEGKIVETITKKLTLADQNPLPETITVTEDFTKAEIYFWDSINTEKIKSFNRNLTHTRTVGEAVTPSEESFVNVTMRDADDTLLISGFNQRKMQGVPITVRIVNPTADFSAEYKDYKTVSDTNFSDIYYRCEEVLTNADGSFSYSFDMDGINGLHQIIVNMPDGEVFTEEFNFTAIGLINEAMTILKGSNADTIEANFLSVKNKLGMIDRRFDNLTNKQFVYNFMLSKIASLGDSFDLEKARSTFKTALEYAYNAENPAGLKEWLKQDGNEWTLKNTAVHNVFMDMSTTKVGLVADNLKTSTDLADFTNKFKNGVIMTELKLIGNKNVVLTTFNRFPETAGVDTSDYSQLRTDERKDNVNLAFMEQVKLKNTYSEAISLFEYLAEEELRLQNLEGSDGDGGYIGGGGGGGSYVPSPRPQGTIFESPPNTMPEGIPDWYVEPSTIEVFSDLSNAEWAKECINALYAQGIINGVGDGKFAPNNHVKREEIAKMIVVALNLEATEGEAPEFADVDKNSWYYEYVKIAYQHGIIAGVGDNRFGVGEFATREAVATMICRAADAKGMYLDDVITIYPFDDRDSISEWAVESVEILRESMIINGMYGNMFVPKNNITRAETAKLVYGLLQYK